LFHSRSCEQEEEVGPQAVAVMQREGRTLRLAATEAGSQLLLLGGAPLDPLSSYPRCPITAPSLSPSLPLSLGAPLDEPIAARGPFVMNTDAEIAQANADFRSGKMGR